MKYLYFYLSFWTVWRFSMFRCPYMWEISIFSVSISCCAVNVSCFSLLASGLFVCWICFLWLVLWCTLVLYCSFSLLVGWLTIYELENWMLRVFGYIDVLICCLSLCYCLLVCDIFLFLIFLFVDFLYS